MLECQVCLVVSDVNTNKEYVVCPECGTSYNVCGKNREDFVIQIPEETNNG